MEFKIWAYLAATIGMIFAYLLIFKLKKLAYGFWIACISLAIFLGGSISVDKLLGIENSFNIVKDNVEKSTAGVKTIDARVKTIDDVVRRIDAQSETIDLVAKSAAEASRLARDASEKNAELDKHLLESKANLDELKELTYVSGLIIAAQNDDVEAYDKLSGIVTTKPGFSNIAASAITQARTSLNLGYNLIDWREGIDPKKLSIEELRKYYSELMPLYHTDMVNTVYKSEVISKKDKMQFFADVLRTGKKSLKALYYAGEYFVKLANDKELTWNPYDRESLLKWWDAHKDKIQ